MIIYPAIDLKDGNCVRLKQGDMEQATIFHERPAAQAHAFAQAGARWLHLVDLNGAFEGKPVNQQAVADILSVVTIPVQLGGGIRSMDTVRFWLEAGIRRVILGTAALKNPDLVKEACREFPGRLAVGIDARDGMVATEGWAEVSTMPALDLARRMEQVGTAAIIYTDIARDGMMQGVNAEATAALAEALDIPVIASGGVASLNDITRLNKLEEKGIEGVIIGRALYEQKFTLQEALKAAETEPC